MNVLCSESYNHNREFSHGEGVVQVDSMFSRESITKRLQILGADHWSTNKLNFHSVRPVDDTNQLGKLCVSGLTKIFWNFSVGQLECENMFEKNIGD